MPAPKDPIKLAEFKEKMRVLSTGRVVSQETKDKISKTLTGHIIPEEVKNKISKKLKGVPLTEERRLKIVGNTNKKGKPVSEETKKKISDALKGKYKGKDSWNYGKKHSEETKIAASKLRKGIKKSQEIRIKQKGVYCGERHHNWKGGKTPIRKKLRETLNYRFWREEVFKRDNYQCVIGGKEHGHKLQADHIIPFADILDDLIELNGVENLYESAINCSVIWDINNGRTLCENCHKNTETWGNRGRAGKIKRKKNK